MPDLDCVKDVATLIIHTTEVIVTWSSLYEVSHCVKNDDTKVELAHSLFGTLYLTLCNILQ